MSGLTWKRVWEPLPVRQLNYANKVNALVHWPTRRPIWGFHFQRARHLKSLFSRDSQLGVREKARWTNTKKNQVVWQKKDQKEWSGKGGEGVFLWAFNFCVWVGARNSKTRQHSSQATNARTLMLGLSFLFYSFHSWGVRTSTCTTTKSRKIDNTCILHSCPMLWYDMG